MATSLPGYKGRERSHLFLAEVLKCTFSLPASQKAWPLNILLLFSKKIFPASCLGPGRNFNLQGSRVHPQNSIPPLSWSSRCFPPGAGRGKEGLSSQVLCFQIRLAPAVCCPALQAASARSPGFRLAPTVPAALCPSGACGSLTALLRLLTSPNSPPSSHRDLSSDLRSNLPDFFRSRGYFSPHSSPVIPS